MAGRDKSSLELQDKDSVACPDRVAPFCFLLMARKLQQSLMRLMLFQETHVTILEALKRRGA